MTMVHDQLTIHTQDETLRDLEFELPQKVVQGLSDAALFGIFYESQGEKHDGAEVIPAAE